MTKAHGKRSVVVSESDVRRGAGLRQGFNEAHVAMQFVDTSKQTELRFVVPGHLISDSLPQEHEKTLCVGACRK